MSSSRPVNSIQFILIKSFSCFGSRYQYIFLTREIWLPSERVGLENKNTGADVRTWEQEPFPWRSGSCTTPIRRKALWDVHWAAQLWGSSKTRLVSRVKDENLNQYFWEIIILCFPLSKRARGRIIESIGEVSSLPPHPQVEECRHLVGEGEGWGTDGESSAVRAPFY